MRLHLILAIVTAFLLVLTFRAGHKPRFSFTQVEEAAKKRAQAKYVPLPNVLPPQLKSLTLEQEYGIFWNDTYRLWRKKGLPFQVDFYHVSKAFPHAPPINAVDRKGAHPLVYSPAQFRFSGLHFDSPIPEKLGYSGFYLRYPINKPDSLDGFFSVQGASYLRALAKDQVYGLTARGVALSTEATGKKEEFPDFCEWWLQEPTPNATEIVLDALLDGPSVTGAYEFKISPGGVTTIQVHAILYFRQAVDQLGIAPFSSMYLFGENAKDHFGDNVHPEIHDSDGVLMEKNSKEWIWHPLQQTKDLQLYSFPDENPRGFGLIQRDRDFQHYQDLNTKYNVRPSAWVTPQGNWGKGTVQLTQLPTNNTNLDNVVLSWHPDQPIKARDRLDMSYSIDFYMNDATRPPLAYCKQTLINSPAPPPPLSPPQATPPLAPSKPVLAGPVPTPTPTPAPALPKDTVPVQFMLDFVGNGIENLPANQPPDLELTCVPPETYLREKKVEKNTYDNSWRVTFTLIPAKRNVPIDILCHLTHRGKPLTETCTYTWHQ